MCKDILEDKNIKLEIMNNLTLPLPVPAPVPTPVPVPAPAPITVAPSPGPAPAPENGGTPPSAPRHLPEKVLEMYNMLIGITTELERIKYELAKREAEHCRCWGRV